MTEQPARKVIVACPHGFCAGVVRAIASAERALEIFAPPVYCLNEIVHNELVVRQLADRGIRFVKNLADIPPGATVLFSAHGVAPSVRETAAGMGLRVIDATCPFVNKIHNEVRRYAADGYTIFLVGHEGHEEIVGITGEAPASIRLLQTAGDAERATPIWDNGKTVVVTQTTLSVSQAQEIIGVLVRRFPAIKIQKHKDICYATENRQKAVEALCSRADMVLILGSRNSSNTKRLVEIAEKYRPGAAFMVSDESDLGPLPLEKHSVIGITAGASTPESFMNLVLARLESAGYGKVERLTVAEENIRLPLPSGIRP